MALEYLEGFKWADPLSKEERTLTLTVRELIILMTLNQDHGIANRNIPTEISIDLQRKLKEALDQDGTGS